MTPGIMIHSHNIVVTQAVLFDSLSIKIGDMSYSELCRIKLSLFYSYTTIFSTEFFDVMICIVALSYNRSLKEAITIGMRSGVIRKFQT